MPSSEVNVRVNATPVRTFLCLSPHDPSREEGWGSSPSIHILSRPSQNCYLRLTATACTSLSPQLLPASLSTLNAANILRNSKIYADDTWDSLALRSCLITCFAAPPQPSGRPLPLPSHLQPQVHAPPYHSLLSFQLACLNGPIETALQVDGELLPNMKMRLLGASYHYILVDSVQIPWFSILPPHQRHSVFPSFPLLHMAWREHFLLTKALD